jgi:hypothetical protein
MPHLPGLHNSQAVKSTADELDKKIVVVEEQLFQMKITGRGQDMIRYPTQLVGKIMHLADGLAVADFPPTEEQLEVHRLLGHSKESLRTWLDGILSRDLEDFNNLLRDMNVPNVSAAVQE